MEVLKMKKKQKEPAKKPILKHSPESSSVKKNEKKSERCREIFQTYVGDSIAIESIFGWHL